MSKRLLSAALAATLGVAAFSANAAQPGSGTITINGRITAASCTIAVNGGSNDATVTLPTVQTTDLATAGDATGYTAVNIALSGCSANGDSVTQVRPYFEQGPNTDLATGYLANNGTAGNVEVMLATDTSGAGSALQLQKDSGNQGTAAVDFTTDGKASFTYYAAYVANGGSASAGTVTTSVQYTLDYL